MGADVCGHPQARHPPPAGLTGLDEGLIDAALAPAWLLAGRPSQVGPQILLPRPSPSRDCTRTVLPTRPGRPARQARGESRPGDIRRFGIMMYHRRYHTTRTVPTLYAYCTVRIRLLDYTLYGMYVHATVRRFRGTHAATNSRMETLGRDSRHPFDRPSTTPSKVRTRRHARQPESALLVCFGNTFLKYTVAATTCGCPEWGPGALGRVTLRRRRGGGGAAASKGGSQARRRLSGAISRLPATRTRSLRGGREIAG